MVCHSVPYFLFLDASARPVRLGYFPDFRAPPAGESSLGYPHGLIEPLAFEACSISDLKGLLPAFENFLAERQAALQDCTALIWVKGPGSFTGLRISAVFCQAMMTLKQLSIVGVDALQIVAQAFWQSCTLAKPEGCIVLRRAGTQALFYGVYRFSAQLSRANEPMVSPNRGLHGRASFRCFHEEILPLILAEQRTFKDRFTLVATEFGQVPLPKELLSAIVTEKIPQTYESHFQSELRPALVHLGTQAVYRAECFKEAASIAPDYFVSSECWRVPVNTGP